MITFIEEFEQAIKNLKSDEDAFILLIQKFEELKQVLESNFRVIKDVRKWYGKKVHIDGTIINMSIEEKINHKSGKYLFISINGYRYVMGIGEIGDLKDKVYFLESSMSHGNKTIINCGCGGGVYGLNYWCLEDKLTCVQLFSMLIKRYKKFLVVK
jgi:hypothetical protein